MSRRRLGETVRSFPFACRLEPSDYEILRENAKKRGQTQASYITELVRKDKEALEHGETV